MAATSGEETRTGVITVYYYSPSAGSAGETVTVAQNAGNGPVLTVQPLAVTVPIEGGICEFTYTVENPVSGGELECAADVNWIYDFDCSDYGTVRFSVEENSVKQVRSGVITASYIYPNGSVPVEIVVVQDHSTGVHYTLEDFIGTYEASGPECDDTYLYTFDATWTMRIYPDEDDDSVVLIDGIVPFTQGLYSPGAEQTTPAYLAKATVNFYGQLVVSPQLTGYIMNYYDCYLGYTTCTSHEPGVGFYYNYLRDCTFSYNEVDGTWESDYGILLSLFRSNTLTSFYTFLDVVAPVITLKKLSDSPTAAVESVGTATRSIEECSPHFNFMKEEGL